jgi:hypothetical protein
VSKNIIEISVLLLNFSESLISYHPSPGHWDPSYLQTLGAPLNVQFWSYVSDDAPANPSMGDVDATE